MNTRTIIIKALSIFNLHTEISPFDRQRILKAKERCFKLITGERYRASVTGVLSVPKMLAVAATVIISVAAGITLYYSSFKTPGGGVVASSAYITFFTGSVSIERGGSSVPLMVKAEIRDGDVIRVAEKSCLVMQTGDGLVTRFESNTEAVVDAITDVRHRSISIRQGKILSLVGKLSKGDGYEVRTQNAFAAVRGTMFLTQYDGREFVVAVSEGKVAVDGAVAAGSAETIVEANMSAVRLDATGVTTLRPIATTEKLELSKLSETPVVPEIQQKGADEIRAIFTESKLEEKEIKINSEIEDETGLSRVRMSEKYGRVDTLTLYTGRVIRGVIVSRGKQFKVLTQSGPVLVNAEDIQNTETTSK